MATVHSYLRFSNEKQAEGRSQERQENYALEFIKEGGHELSDLKLDDFGKSGFKGDKQAALKKFMAEIGKRVRPGDILFVEAIDRLGRRGVRHTQDLVNKILNAGIDIAIALPVKKVYRASDENDVGGAIELAAFAFQAYTYSKNLSERITEDWDDKRKRAAQGERFGKRSRCWLTWDETSQRYKVKPGADKTIEYIFRRTVDGLGERALLRELANKQIPALGRSGKWNNTMLGNFFADRSVCGEWQAFHFDANHKRKALGEPIPDFYPRIISDELYELAQAARSSRLQKRGPSGKFVNLFPSLLHCSVDGQPMHLVTIQPKKKTIARRFVSYGHIRRVNGACNLSINCPTFEQAILKNLLCIKPSDILPSDQSTDGTLAAKRGELAGITTRLATLQAKLETSDDDIDVLLSAVRNLAKRKEDVKKQVKLLERSEAVSNASPMTEAQNIMQLLSEATGDELHALRVKLRQVLANWIERIDVAPYKINGGRLVGFKAAISFKGGANVRQHVETGERERTFWTGPIDPND